MKRLNETDNISTERCWRAAQTGMKRLLVSLLAIAPLLATASTPLEATLGELVQGADHFVIGTVVDVDMKNWLGFTVADPRRKTGPGFFPNRIRLHIRVDQVRSTNAQQVPAVLTGVRAYCAR